MNKERWVFNMKVLYFDCFSGISGDMTVGALMDLGVDPKMIEQELRKLNLEDEYELKWEKTIKKGISATKMKVILKSQQEAEAHHHEYEHHYHHHVDNHSHHHRHYDTIVQLIQDAELNESVKQLSLNIFERIGKAEGNIHNLPLEKVHFHEVGAIDSIVDIVATAVAIDQLQPDKIVSSPVPTGSGKIRIDHGIYPVPAPATLEILKNIPLQKCEIPFELTTPTGAGIIAALSQEFGTIPSMQVSQIGYGAGTKDFSDRPNVLRVFLGEMNSSK
ncbi:nickel pincer cofactor biosynthesis protein LarC [Heyndrickxia ginsengihumi]|uniref:nickel pincer cofactor biosynthesis protein LarC n=1 Tax=Heyndrickxia ginsengihumi TaxID=363870 RepID=UPI0022A8634B|nr:nickel pincer cofactor biosynthesis protein LarC [Heyndrickxia ginsengihumi]